MRMMENCEDNFWNKFSALIVSAGRNSQVERKKKNFLQKFHIVHALVFEKIQVFDPTRFVSSMPTHMST